jgi:hypothetical protein
VFAYLRRADDQPRFTITYVGQLALRMAELFGTGIWAVLTFDLSTRGSKQ